MGAVHLGVAALLFEETIDDGGGQSSSPTSPSGAKPGQLLAADLGQKRVQQAVAKPDSQSRPAWGFMQFFLCGARLRRIAALFSLHCLVEGKVLQDQVSLLQLALGWESEKRSRWTSGLGLTMLLGGQATASLVGVVGEHYFTAACHASSIAAFLAFRRSAFWGGLVLLCLGQQRRTVSVSWLLAEAQANGISRGEAAGWVSSLRAAIDVVAALLYGFVYRQASARGRPFEVFVGPVVAMLIAEFARIGIALDNNSRRLPRR